MDSFLFSFLLFFVLVFIIVFVQLCFFFCGLKKEKKIEFKSFKVTI